MPSQRRIEDMSYVKGDLPFFPVQYQSSESSWSAARAESLSMRTFWRASAYFGLTARSTSSMVS